MSFLRIFSLLWLLIGAVPAVSQTVGTVNFDFDSDQLDASALDEIARIADNLKSTDSYKPTVVVGFTDAVGARGYNYDLGLRRARAVANALLEQGVSVDQVGDVSSRGKTQLLVAVSGPERANRRVTVSLEQILAACKSYRDINLSSDAANSSDLNPDLATKLAVATTVYTQLQSSGANGPAFQMAGVAKDDCGQALGYVNDALRKLEYSKRCFCSSARMEVALGN